MEAHARDEWPVGSRYDYNQPQTLQERLEIAKELKESMQWETPIVLDEMGDLGTFEHMYAAWPLRWYVVDTDGNAVKAPKSGGTESTTTAKSGY